MNIILAGKSLVRWVTVFIDSFSDIPGNPDINDPIVLGSHYVNKK